MLFISAYRLIFLSLYFFIRNLVANQVFFLHCVLSMLYLLGLCSLLRVLFGDPRETSVIMRASSKLSVSYLLVIVSVGKINIHLYR